MHTTGIITESAYKALVEFRVRKKKASGTAQNLPDEAMNRLYYIIVFFPGCFFLVSHLVFHMAFVTSAVIALLWFVSFLAAGLLYHRSVIGIATKRPSVGDFDQPRDYALEGDWLVVRTRDTENRISLKRALDLLVMPTVSFIDCGDFGPVLLPFGSGSEHADQRAFLEAIRSQLSKAEKAQ